MKTNNEFIAAQCDQAGEVCEVKRTCPDVYSEEFQARGLLAQAWKSWHRSSDHDQRDLVAMVIKLQTQPPSIPAGYVLVPIEPTRERLRAGVIANYGEDFLNWATGVRMAQALHEQRVNYAAMVATAPQPPKL